MDRCIVYTRHDGGVSICYPAADAISWMGCGGYWNDRPRGFAEVQIERMIADGIWPDAAIRFANAMTSGGCTTAEALGIIRDRDCGHRGIAHELWDLSEVPRDRWFRDAWRRSHNGGPISVNLELARPIQWRHIKHTLADINKKRDGEMLAPIEVDLDKVKEKIRQTREEGELRAIWPKELEIKEVMA